MRRLLGIGNTIPVLFLCPKLSHKAEGGFDITTNIEAADILVRALGSDITDSVLLQQEKTFNLVLRIIHENISLESLTDEEVEELAFKLTDAVQDYRTECDLPCQIVGRVRSLSGKKRHLI